MSQRFTFALILLIAAGAAAFFAFTPRAEPCGDIFGRADNDWHKTCEISK